MVEIMGDSVISLPPLNRRLARDLRFMNSIQELSQNRRVAADLCAFRSSLIQVFIPGRSYPTIGTICNQARADRQQEQHKRAQCAATTATATTAISARSSCNRNHSRYRGCIIAGTVNNIVSNDIAACDCCVDGTRRYNGSADITIYVVLSYRPCV